jgi:pimeloyl-ACP methyl ester carboxylesterase
VSDGGAAAREQHTVVTKDGTRLHAVTAGPDDADEAVVLIHGFCVSSGFWERQIASLSDDVRVVAFDLRGHGRSGSPGPDGIEPETLAADLETVVSRLVPESLPTIVVGHSLGGITAMAYAGGRPARQPSALVLLNTTAHHVPQGAAAILRPRLQAAFVTVVWPTMRRRVVLTPRLSRALRPIVDRLAFHRDRDFRDLATAMALIAATPNRSRAHFSRMLERVDVRPLIGAIDIPVLVVGSEGDRLTPIARSREIAAEILQSRLHTLSRSGHMSPMEEAEDVNGLIRSMLP